MIFPLLFAACLLALPGTSAAASVVAVDVGHGMKDSGAISARGRTEFSFNRRFAGVLEDALQEHGMVVRQVNFAGDIGSLAERPKQAKVSDFFILSLYVQV